MNMNMKAKIEVIGMKTDLIWKWTWQGNGNELASRSNGWARGWVNGWVCGWLAGQADDKQALHLCTQACWWSCVLLIFVHWLKKHQTSKLQAHLGSLPPLRRITSSQRLRKPLANPSSPVPPSAANSAEFMCWATFACGYPLPHGQAATDFEVQGYVQTLIYSYLHTCVNRI